MAQIVNKLNLNRVPQLVDNNSLIFAKNVRLSANGFSPDYGFDKIGEPPFKEGDMYKLVGVIPYNTKFYTLWYQDTPAKSVIWEYDEEDSAWTKIKSAWQYSGNKVTPTTIDGYCTITLNGDILLTIAEDGGAKKIPLKTINITKAKDEPDNYDESLYTQAPIVPLINLTCNGRYKNVIPAGTYQFFVRYEIRDNFYTNWFPASKELFAGFKRDRLTQQGGVRFVDVNVDSDESFILTVNKVVTSNQEFFKSFQLGFIIAHDDEVYARAYKHYSLDTSSIDFDYDTEYIEELDVKDLLESPYNIYNVRNLTAFKNKLYISNYIESNFNPTIDSTKYADIDVTIKSAVNTESHDIGGDDFTFVENNGNKYITSITANNIIGEPTKTVNEILKSLLDRAKDWINSTDIEDGLTKTHRLYHVKETIIKSLPTKIDPAGGEGEIIDDGGESQSYDYAFGTYVLKAELSTLLTSTSLDAILAKIAEYIIGIRTTDGAFVHTYNGNNVTFTIKYQFDVKTGPNSFVRKECVNLITFSIDTTDIHFVYDLKNDYTLIPHQGYNFYVHFVRANGEATNGYLINKSPIIVGEPEEYLDDDVELVSNDMPALYPTFTFKNGLPAGFVACFISILHVTNKVAQIFDIKELYSVGITDGTHKSLVEGDCLELDTRLYTVLKNIPVKRNSVEYLADYRASYDTELMYTFGASGKCIFKTEYGNETYPLPSLNGNGNIKLGSPRTAFIVLPYSNNPEYAQLTKCTPYITAERIAEDSEYDDYVNLNLLGYLCRVKKLQDNINKYFSGSDIYSKAVNYDNQNDSYAIQLTPLAEGSPEWKTYLNSNEWTVYSNYNLNYLSLRENYSPRIVTKNFGDPDNQDDTDRQSFIIWSQESLNLSEVYELKSMFYSYTRKTYYPFDLNNVLIQFDNTIRSSELNGDEDIINMFKFRPTDYYNVPTDKGIIVNLVAVGDNILVHTQDSIYKFSGYNSLTAAGGEDVQMKESEPFDTGIQELFGSEFGYAGLQNKKHQVLSEMGYTFYDSDGQRIYYYTGNANIKVISDDVSKLFKYRPLKDIYFADDYYNNRVFVCLDFGDDKYATLTYDFTAKCFISLHDFHFDWAFKTKTKCYFITPERNNIYRVSDINIADYPSEFSFEDKLYPTGSNKECIIDVIYNDNFEAIKTLNAISWVCNEVKDFIEETNKSTEDMLVAEEWFNHKHAYKGEALRIYSDSVKTPAIDIAHETHDRSNDYSIQQVTSYDRPRYNLGKWTFNYFRNILNRDEDPTHPRVFGEQDTLLYGKYFVARFIFNRTTNFKIEDVTFEISNDYNV